MFLKYGHQMRFTETRNLLVQTITTLGTPSKENEGYFRFQCLIDGSSTTTLAVYGENIGNNLVELAFNIEAVAAALKLEPGQAREWVAAQRAATSREVHENSRWKYPRVGIGNEAELAAFLAAWRALATSTTVPASRSQPLSEKFTSVPYYVEADGSKTFFLPDLLRTKGYQVGTKNRERYFADYWDALAFLKDMDKPAFRRRNGNGIAGIVTCDHGNVEEVSISYLQRLLAAVATKEARDG
ncbi:hypothetical protein [Burkholderia pseudomultivorans]|uniref:Uncharacterized protein n=1 Tax=Burkholderia pseudomultivorans TaxID=1207504 RepID=A0A132EIK4_9BURK|nr:hypothetical protein [Burkholderia pseudomultivorans]KWF30942.1 hypothetical protein WT56_13155 [Burkholderia pseudomultivorans]